MRYKLPASVGLKLVLHSTVKTKEIQQKSTVFFVIFSILTTTIYGWEGNHRQQENRKKSSEQFKL